MEDTYYSNTNDKFMYAEASASVSRIVCVKYISFRMSMGILHCVIKQDNEEATDSHIQSDPAAQA